MPNSETIQSYIDERKSPALQLKGMDAAIIGAGELGPDKEYVLVYSAQRILKLLEKSGATLDQAVAFFKKDMKEKDYGPGAPIFIDELTYELQTISPDNYRLYSKKLAEEVKAGEITEEEYNKRLAELERLLANWIKSKEL